MSNAIRVEPAPAREAGYDVIVERGAFTRLGELAARAAPAAHYAIIADANVARHYGERARALLSTSAPATLFTFPAGEVNKTRATWAMLADAMFDAGIGRDGCVVAIGGGVTGDLAGFVAATYARGIRWIGVPTSLLAMIDASVGGKTGVDVPAGKNLVGAFTQPRVVLVDPAMLDTLPLVELRAGLAEAVKHGVIADAAYLEWIEENAQELLSSDATVAEHLVRWSVEIKANVVSADPLEQGERAILNFGHTAAHAIERLMHFEVAHGYAVAMGMVAEARIGERAGITRTGTAQRIVRVLQALGLPTEPPAGIGAAEMLAAAASDKKARAARVRWSLVAEIGVPARGPVGEWTLEVPAEALAAAFVS